MNRKKQFKVLLIVLVSFGAYYSLFQNFKTIKLGLDTITHQGLISYIFTYLVIGVPIFIGTYLIDPRMSIFRSLGLSKNVFTALAASILFTAPMFVGGLLFFTFNNHLNVESLIAGTLVAGFVEELYFRGFLFGQLFRKANLGFIPSIFFGALLFAFGHLYQSENVNELFGIFLVTFSGAIFFAWLYVEWNFNLWVPILTHTFMNLSWNIFTFDGTALGDTKANIFRGLTIMTAIISTILYKRIKGNKLLITRQNLFAGSDKRSRNF